MEPTIKKNSFIIGSRLCGNLRSGDIVVFRKDGKSHIKRIAAVPGDIVYIDDINQSISINNKFETANRSITVTDDCFFVVGDNSDDSFDSRHWSGPLIKANEIIARAFVK